MVQIRLNTIPLDGKLSDQISATVLNQAGEAYALELKGLMVGKSCNLHPRRNQEIIITVDRVRKMIVEKANFCCDRFEDSIKFQPR
ncbi:MAG: hypothetical protein ABI772_11175 [Bacteroidota bacterium]